MTKRYDESRWSVDFRHLRKQDEQNAPDFRSLIDTDSRPGASTVFNRPMVYALGGAALLVLITLLLNPHQPSATDKPGVLSGLNEDGISLDLAYEMPTDFLLETPWFPLESTTPKFDFSIPNYEYREE